VLLLLKKEPSLAIQSPHDGTTNYTSPSLIPSDALANWESWLLARGIAAEEKQKWELRGWKLYFRDRHLIEVATPGVWSVY
jgi:hypothetical protein